MSWRPEFSISSIQTQCFNFIRVLVSFNATHLYACGTFAFSPACTFIVSYLAPSSQAPSLPPHSDSQPILCSPGTLLSFLAPDQFPSMSLCLPPAHPSFSRCETLAF